MRVERGRSTRPKTPRGDRICKWCEKKEKIQIEDEVHFILECDIAKGIRERMMSEIQEIAPNICHLDDQNLFIYL